jgi:nucleotide-binding universal stress UspA family protein
MTEPKIEHILCAVRGTPESRTTVTEAINLALEAGARLTFAYAVDAEFKARTTGGSSLSVIYGELVSMSEFVMLILCDRAQRRGVSQVDFIIREGNVRRQLCQIVAETDAEVLVMGTPARGPGTATFKAAEFDAFVAELKQLRPLRVVLIPSAPTE